jgi:probable rRNA maturation factor
MSAGSTLLFGAIPAHLKFSALEKRKLAAFARALSRQLGGGRSFNCLLADDCELRRLNAAFLQHDYPTDVLSFPASDHIDDLGEIAISVERADEQAREFGHDCFDEVQILMLHGLLHLTGLDHENDHGEMARAEQHWRTILRLPQTLIDRSSAALPLP